jgi:hypothetical protein
MTDQAPPASMGVFGKSSSAALQFMLPLCSFAVSCCFGSSHVAFAVHVCFAVHVFGPFFAKSFFSKKSATSSLLVRAQYAVWRDT